MQELLPNIFKVYRDEDSGGWGYSYLVQRPHGNVLLARMAKTASIKGEYTAIQSLGGLQRIYITDFHFAGEHVDDVSKQFGASVYCSQIEVAKIKKRGITNLVPFEYVDHLLEEEIRVVPTPGHTAGGVCYLLIMNAKRYLFTGDFLYFDGQRWIVGSKTYADVKDSLDCLQSLDYDYLVGCGDDALGSPYVEMTNDTKPQFFQALLNQFKKSNVAS
jgi:glyoxylase-like metal-dependent hydrolase (beta-lactamase superfamily II)